MTFAYWSILIVFTLPYFAVLYAKVGKGFSNHTPREYLSSLQEGRKKRAYWAHQNTFEILPLYFAAIIIGHLQSVDQSTLDMIAAGFVLLRMSYIFAYIFDLATLRSIIWAGSFGCILGIFFLAS